MNPAALAILEELLAVSAASNANLIKMLGALGVGGAVGEGLGTIAKVSAPVAVALGAVKVAGELVGKAFEGLVAIAKGLYNTISSTVSALYNFSLQAAMGSAKLSDFYASFKDLPFVIGKLFGILSDLTKYNEVLLENYQKLSQSGASFSGSLSMLAQQAARSYLTLDQFSKVVSENSQVFATMGGNVQSGINRFVQIQNQMMGPNSPYARQLLGMGYTFEEAGGLIASYMRGQGTMNKESLANTEAVIRGTVEYGQQLDTLTKLTGKRREQIEKEVREIEEEESWQQYLTSLPANAAAAAKTALMEAQQRGGKDFATSMRLAIQTGIVTPLTDDSKNLSVTSRGTREAYLAALADAVRTGRSASEVSKLGYNYGQMLVSANKQTLQSMNNLPGIMAATGNSFMKGANTVLAYGRTVGDQNEALAKITKQQTEQAKGSAEAMARSELAARQFGLELLGLISTALAPVMPHLRELAKALAGALTAVLGNKGFKDSIMTITKWFTDSVQYLTSAGSIKDFTSRLWNLVMGTFEGLKPTIMALLSVMADSVGTMIKDFLFGGPYKKLMENTEEYDKRLKQFLKTPGTTKEQFDQSLEGKRLLRNIKDQENIIAERDRRQMDQFSTIRNVFDNIAAATEDRRNKADRANELARESRRGSRALGTAEVLGRLTEPEDTVTQIHAGERVLNPQEAYDYNNLASQVAVLNNTTAQLLQVMKQTADNTRRTYDATKSLNGNVLHQLA